jgi:hypothetical protein
MENIQILLVILNAILVFIAGLMLANRKSTKDFKKTVLETMADFKLIFSKHADRIQTLENFHEQNHPGQKALKNG